MSDDTRLQTSKPQPATQFFLKHHKSCHRSQQCNRSSPCTPSMKRKDKKMQQNTKTRKAALTRGALKKNV
jgi:hypothetical protein